MPSKRRQRSKSKCKSYLKNKIKINMEEYKTGRYVSPKQAVAVSYSQILKSHPHCKKILKRKNLKNRSKPRQKNKKKSKRKL